MIQAVRCPACGGRLEQPLPSQCPYCRAALQVSVMATPRAAQPPHGVLAERFAAAERDPSIVQLMLREPSGVRQYLLQGWGVLFGVLFVGAVLFMFSRFPDTGFGSGPLDVVPKLILGGMLLVGVGIALTSLFKMTSHASSLLLRRIGHVADERVEVSGGSGDSSATTTYYATLDFGDGSRSEYQVTHDLAGKLARGDIGVAYVKGTWLLDFERLKV